MVEKTEMFHGVKVSRVGHDIYLSKEDEPQIIAEVKMKVSVGDYTKTSSNPIISGGTDVLRLRCRCLWCRIKRWFKSIRFRRMKYIAIGGRKN